MVIGSLAVDGWAVTFGTVRKGLGGLRVRLFVYPPKRSNSLQVKTITVPRLPRYIFDLERSMTRKS